MTGEELDLKVKFVVDERGKKTAAQLDMRTFKKLVRFLEDVEDQKLIESAKRRGPKFRQYEDVRADMIKAGLL